MYKTFTSPVHRAGYSVGRQLLNQDAISSPTQIIRCRCVSSSSTSQTNYYDVLRVKADSSDKEIRESFIKLSKEYHPDHTKDHGSAEKFQRIMEAYRVLSKPDTRKTYDCGLNAHEVPVYSRSGFSSTSNGQEFYYYQRGHSHNADPNEYYGISGMKKKSNSLVVWAIIGFAAFGVCLQALAIKSSFTFKRDVLDRKSIEANKIHNEIRAEASKHNRSDQLDRLLSRLKKVS